MTEEYNIFEHLLDESAEYDELYEAARRGNYPINLTGVSDAVRAHIAFSLCKKLNKRPIFVSYSEVSAKKILEDVNYFFQEKSMYFPERELLFYDIEAAGNDIKKQRLEILEKIISNEEKINIVTTIEALLSPTLSKKIYCDNVTCLKIGDEYELDFLSENLVNLGYTRVDLVEGCGQFSIRGGILDFFPFWSEQPFRIEFFDTEIESIRIFDVDTQRTVSDLDETKITPVYEEPLNAEIRSLLVEKLEVQRQRYLVKNELSEFEQASLEVLSRDIDRLNENTLFPSIDKYIPLINEIPSTLIDYLSDDYIIFFDDPIKIHESALAFENRFSDRVSDMLEKGIIFKNSFRYFLDYKNAISKLTSMNFIGMSALISSGLDFKPKYLLTFTVKSLNNYNGKLELLYDALRYYKNNKYRIVVLTGGETRGKNLTEQLNEENFSAVYKESFTELPAKGQVFVCRGDVSRGFEYPLIRTVVISDKEIFGLGKKKKRRERFSGKEKIQSFSDLCIGDYVVHQNHGIGKYVGIHRLTVSGVKKDYLKILYKGEDCLYVPTDQLKFIFKYTGGGGSVKLNRLDGQEWKKTKEKVSSSCKEMAEKLISLYAKRESLKGISFMKDSEWQKDFESAFPYEETDDQLRSVEDIKHDMESSKPMDRLLCGDVGYGKTEVAMRAAFKAVMSGYQVAYLVPTTILANQHFSNFKQRMSGFGVNIGMLSRFVSPASQKKVIDDLNRGVLDIVIGTHKLLNKNILYKKLGLLIIDEEQRFGVSHKEKIKELKNEIDVLTLTATPIPRTLHMSLSGIRDMSVLSTPPGDRYPVATYVLEYNSEVIKEAINKEISRGGQVYYLFNRVDGIERKTEELSLLLPDAKVVCAHGKMSETQLENIMMDVSEGEIDVLVCTTIIETGLDIPNVNTIIIEDSERLGLSQLYQLRGRVGRSNRLAYAYLTYRKNKVLNEDAQKRLMAIRQFTEFGSGFKIAMKDLEIRGTGNVIGPQQSGNMEVVGYDLYCKLLSKAVSELKGIEEQDETETLVDLAVNAFIPDSYISSHMQRIELYKRIASIETKEDLMDVYDETLDRYGDVPSEVHNLMMTALIRYTGSLKKFTEIKSVNFELFLYFESENPPDFEKCIEKISTCDDIFIRNTKKPHILYKMPKFKNDTALLNGIYHFLCEI